MKCCEAIVDSELLWKIPIEELKQSLTLPTCTYYFHRVDMMFI
jgi:hypothetical protein